MQAPREIFRRIMHFERSERMFLWHWTFGFFGGEDTRGTQFWQQTVERWHHEGLPADVNTSEKVNGFFGVDRRLHLNLRLGIWPPHKTEVLEEAEAYRITIDRSGRVLKEFNKGHGEGSMPQYIRHALASREDWRSFARERLDPDVRGRDHFTISKDGATLLESAPGAPNFDQARQLLLNSDLPVEVNTGSMFGWLREWMGLKGISYALCDDEAWVQEMMEHLADLTLSVFARVLGPLDVPIDHAAWWEDMACNKGSLISPSHVRRLMVPCYRRVNDYLRGRRVDVIGVDSDGDVSKLIPLWIEGGLNCIYPNEVNAGMDVATLRRQYGRDLLLIGGISKHALAEGKTAIHAELDRCLPVISEGGYLPDVDHSVPPDVPFENYMYYHRMLVEGCAHQLERWRS